ncbi:hypothetical protein DSO57_1012800 [Entomophthora muscae]|uniref:Uncharacterized protein n=1 Tax=Entomophthora muscae TaxID=34485 RepID=A0ACC2URE5_9FUNG|nr:hypothetical protein DSO57_1012800 [Entomophthora muscae]
MYIILTGLIDSMVPPQSCGGPSLLGPQAVCPQVFRNPPQVRSLTDNLSSLLHILVHFSFWGETIVQSLTCDNPDFHNIDHTLPTPTLEEVPAPALSTLEENNLAPLQAPLKLPHAPTCTPWLLARLVLMGLNAYFPQLSPVSSLWSSL